MVKYDAKIMIKSIIHFCIQKMIANNFALYLSIYNRNISCVCNVHIHTHTKVHTVHTIMHRYNICTINVME